MPCCMDRMLGAACMLTAAMDSAARSSSNRYVSDILAELAWLPKWADVALLCMHQAAANHTEQRGSQAKRKDEAGPSHSSRSQRTHV